MQPSHRCCAAVASVLTESIRPEPDLLTRFLRASRSYVFGSPRASHGASCPSSMRCNVTRIWSGWMLPDQLSYGWSRNATTSSAEVTNADTNAMGTAWMTGTFAAVGLHAHVAEDGRGTDAEHDPQRRRHRGGSLGGAGAAAVAALRLLVEPLAVGRFLPRVRRIHGREVGDHRVDPMLHRGRRFAALPWPATPRSTTARE